jgi:hypothetical protein
MRINEYIKKKKIKILISESKFFVHLFQLRKINANKKTSTRKSWQPTFLLGWFLGTPSFALTKAESSFTEL